MKCPYCTEEVSDDAVVCRVCGHELFYGPLDQIVGKVSALEKATSRITARLDKIEPRNHDVIEHQISMLRKEVAEITESLAAGRPSNQRASLQRDQQDDKQGDQQETEQGAAETRKHPFRTAGRYLLDSYTAADTEWKRIGFALLLAVVVAVLAVQLSTALGQVLDVTSQHVSRENDPGQGALTVGWIVLDFVYACGLLVFPFMCGFVTSLSWPGRRTLRRVMSFVLLGAFAGLLIWFVSALLGLFGGMVLGLPAVPTGFYYSEWHHVVQDWGYTAVTWISMPLSAFVSGGLLADSIKIPKFSLSQRRGLAFTLVSALTGRGREPNTRLVKFVDKLPAILFALLPLVIKNLDTIRQLV